MRAAIYIRVSSDEQIKEGFSIEAQKALLERKCVEWNYTVTQIYNDEGYSAKNTKRPALQQLIKDAENKAFDVVVYWRLDRLTRSSKDFHKLVEQLNHYDVGIKSASEAIDTTTAIGRFQLELSVSLAQLERETISERVTFVMQEGVRQGRWHGGPVPYGYAWDGQMHIIQEEADNLRLLRDLYMQGNGFFTVAKQLNALGRNRRGFRWSSQSVWYALDNPFYAGKLRYGGKKKNGKYATRKKGDLVDCIWSDSDHPQIYTWEEYEEHNKIMLSKQFYGHTKIRDYWFAGILRCAKCGARLSGRPHYNKKKDGTASIKAIYYICGTKQNGSGCKMPILRQEHAERMIMQYIRNVQATKERLDKASSKIKKEVANHDTELNDLNKEIQAIAERRKKWQYMFAEDLINESDFRLRRREEDDKENIIKDRVDTLKSENIGISSSTMNLMFEILDLWVKLEDKERNEVAQSIFRSIVIDCFDENPVGRKGKVMDFGIVSVDYK
jgi:site-specific DNA recombinase